MSEQLTAPFSGPAEAARPDGGREPRSWRVPAVQAFAVLVVSAVVGVVASVVFYAWWSPARGLVYRGHWQRGLLSIDPLRWSATADESVFAGVAEFTVIGLVGGLLIGAVAAVLARNELVSLAAGTVGSLGAGVLAYALIALRAPASPAARIATDHVANGSLVSDTIHLGSPWLALVFAGGALVVLAAAFLLISRRPPE